MSINKRQTLLLCLGVLPKGLGFKIMSTSVYNNTNNTNNINNIDGTNGTTCPTKTEARETCSICCSKYTGVKRNCVACLFCNKDACKQCWESYLISTPREPNCMHCKTPWNREFIDKTFSASFRSGALKQRRAEHLLETEEAFLPSTQWYARMEKIHNRMTARRADINKKVVDLEVQLMRTGGSEPWKYAAHTYAQYRQMVKDRVIVTSQLRQLAREIRAGPDGARTDGDARPKRTFIRRCPRGECKGYLSTQHKCGLCKGKVCSKCLEPVDQNDDHVCNPDTVASIDSLMKDTRSCPKCGIHIYKIDGCDQMWCTECKTAFSWNTGKIETGRIHNPHWYEWQRRTTNGQIPREPGDVAGGDCNDFLLGNMQRPNGYAVPGFDQFMYSRNYDVDPRFVNLHRTLIHILHVVIPRLSRLEYTEETNRDLRIKYLLQMIDKSAWKRTLYTREKKREKDNAIRQALEVFITVAGEALWKLTNSHTVNDEHDTIKELDVLRVYTVECLADILRRFNSSLMINIDNQFIYYMV